MKLYEIPRESVIRGEASDGSAFVTFHHIDGMYSLCTSERGALCHLYAATELEKLDDGTYRILEEQL